MEPSPETVIPTPGLTAPIPDPVAAGRSADASGLPPVINPLALKVTKGKPLAVMPLSIDNAPLEITNPLPAGA